MLGRGALLLCHFQHDFVARADTARVAQPAGNVLSLAGDSVRDLQTELGPADAAAAVDVVSKLRHYCRWDLVVHVLDWHPANNRCFPQNCPVCVSSACGETR